MLLLQVLRAPLDFPLPNIKQKAFIDMMDFKLAIDINLKNFRKSQPSGCVVRKD
jgi:hypothetical protein